MVNTYTFFETLYKGSAGVTNIRAISPGGKISRDSFHPCDDFSWLSDLLKNQNDNLFFGVATRDGKGGKKENIVEIPTLWVDIDFKETPQREADERLADFPLEPSAIILSGGGYHIYWLLKEPADFKAIPAVEDINKRLAAYFGGDLNATDASRILRVPYSLNHKYRPARQVTIQGNIHPERAYTLMDFDFLPEVQQMASEGHQPATKEAQEQLEVLLQCDFIKWCKDNPESVPEPLWFAMISNVARVSPGGPGLAHELSKSYPKYSKRETDQKILHALNDAGPLTCQYIKATGFDCGKDCKVKSPIGLLAKGRRGEEKEKTKEPKKTQADLLIELALEKVEIFFEDQYQQVYVRIPVKGHFENQPLHSTAFKRWLGGLYYQQHKKGCNPDAMRSAVETLSAHAMFAGSGIFTLHNRVAWRDGAIWYDLSNERWQAIKVTADGWEIVNNPPILFRRYTNQTAQTMPSHDGDITRLFDFINIHDDDAKLLALIWLITAFVPDIPHAIAVLWGPQGSAKSTFFKWAKEIVDPGVKKLDSLPRTPEDLIKKMNNNWTCLFDNVSRLQSWQSDCLCRAVTGEGYSQRRLYTDNEEMILQFQRVLGLNGVNIAASSPDLLDRCIILELGRIPKDRRKREKTLKTEFQKALPYIVGGVFDTLSRAMRLYPKAEEKLTELPRMADFTTWGYAIAEALGGRGQEFLNAYFENIKFQNEQVIESDPVAACLCRFMDSQNEWEGRPGELLAELEEIAEILSIKTGQKYWPQQPNTLTRRLNKLKVNLAEVGIEVITGIKTEKNNLLRVSKMSPVAPVSPEPSIDEGLQAGDNLEQTGDNENTSRIPPGKKGNNITGLEQMEIMEVKSIPLGGESSQKKDDEGGWG